MLRSNISLFQPQNDPMVQLKNGTEAPKSDVDRIMTILCQLFNHGFDPLTVNNLYDICKDPTKLASYLPYPIQQLEAHGFLVNGQVPTNVKNIVLSSIENCPKSYFGGIAVTDPRKESVQVSPKLN